MKNVSDSQMAQIAQRMDDIESMITRLPGGEAGQQATPEDGGRKSEGDGFGPSRGEVVELLILSIRQMRHSMHGGPMDMCLLDRLDNMVRRLGGYG